MEHVRRLSGVSPVIRISRCSSDFLLALQVNVPASVFFTPEMSRASGLLIVALEEISCLPDTEDEQSEPGRSSGSSKGDERSRNGAGTEPVRTFLFHARLSIHTDHHGAPVVPLHPAFDAQPTAQLDLLARCCDNHGAIRGKWAQRPQENSCQIPQIRCVKTRRTHVALLRR